MGAYRAVLDLLYIDGRDRPKVIVMWDTVMRHGSGPCPFSTCKDQWVHKSKIDTTTMLSLARQSVKRPRVINFGYLIPIVRVSNDDFERIRHDGYGILAAIPPDKVGPINSFWAGFRKTYPGAWNYVALSKVGFNPRHTQALISVFQVCGEDCRSNEIVFLKRFGKQWRVIERIPDYTEFRETSGNLRYRGPIGVKGKSSQIVALDASGTKPRSEADDSKKVYAAIFDSLYSFYGESPKQLVVMDLHPWAPGDLPAHRSKIDPITLSNYSVVAQIRDAVPRFRYRLPITWVSDTTLKLVALKGAARAKAAAARFEEETSPLWYAFHAKYPSAWGYASLGRVAFNPRHTEALVFTRHFCGTACVNADTWFLKRTGAKWSVIERMPRDNQANWTLDGLRYLGPEAGATWYRPRRLHGLFVAEQTGEPLPNLNIQVKYYTSSTFFETDSHGAYSIDNLPVNAGISLLAKCPEEAGGKWLLVAPIAVTPGMDSTFNAKVEFALCPE